MSINEHEQSIRNEIYSLFTSNFEDLNGLAYFITSNVPIQSLISLYNCAKKKTSPVPTPTVESYELNVRGVAAFENEVVTAIKKAEADKTSLDIQPLKAYEVGDIFGIKTFMFEDRTDFVMCGYYKCVVAGRTALENERPSFVSDNKYIETVIDDKCTWQLVEVVKPYIMDCSYEIGDIIETTFNSEKVYYKAKNSGDSNYLKKPNFTGIEVIDGNITWLSMTQSRTTIDTSAYTSIQKAVGAELDLSKYTVYSDNLLLTPLALPETVSMENPISLEHETVTTNVTYKAVYI